MTWARDGHVFDMAIPNSGLYAGSHYVGANMGQNQNADSKNKFKFELKKNWADN